MEFIFPVRVYYEDTDVAGVVYYANYLKFMERGRTEWLRALGVDQDILIDQGIAFAVRKAEVDYYKPARFNDALEVISRIEQITPTRIVFRQSICQAGEPDRLLCEGKIMVVCVTMNNMKPRAIPQSLLEELKRES
jgi:acyl-CoA thioester hydrolase